MTRDSVSPIAALASLGEGAAFFVRGRALEVHAGVARLVDASGEFPVVGFGDEHRGALVLVDGSIRNGRPVASAIEILAACLATTPP